MTEREVMAQKIAGDHYGLMLDSPHGAREWLQGRLKPEERKAFEAGWEAAKQYYTKAPQNVPNQS